MRTVPVMICCALSLLSSARGISEQCKIDGASTISCRCIGDEVNPTFDSRSNKDNFPNVPSVNPLFSRNFSSRIGTITRT